jgi:hypothetical protein
VGRRIFLPSRTGRVQDAAVARMQRIRTVVGLGAFLWVSYSYRLAQSMSDVAEDRFDQSWATVLALSATFPVLVGILLLLARPEHRRELLRRAARPLLAIVSVIGSMAVWPAMVLSGFGTGMFKGNTPMTVVEWLVTVFIILYVTPFSIYGISMSLVHVFRTADIHETVPPLIAILVVWEMLLVDVFTGAYPGVPEALRAVMIIGAPLSVTIVGFWELHRLRTRYGLRLRGALMR